MVFEWLQTIDSRKVASIMLDGLVGVVILIVALSIFFRVGFYLRQRKWRKGPKIDDKAFFHNMGGGITIGKVTKISEDGKSVMLAYSTANSSSSGWYKPENLTYLTQDEYDYIIQKRLEATLKSWRK